MQGPDEAYPNNYQSNEADPIDHQFYQAFLDSGMFDAVDPNNYQFDKFSINLDFDEAYLNNPQFNRDNPEGHQSNEAYPQNRHLVDAVPNTEETDTLDDQLPNFKRRRTENTESSHIALAHEHAPITTSVARASVASMSTDRSSRFSASTARSSFVSTSTGRSSVASMMSPLVLVDQPGEESAYKYKCLICHMGEGDSRKVYVRKEGNTPDEHAAAGTPESITKVNPGRAPKPKNSWNSQTLLEKHIRENHLLMFQRTNSSEYICFFCPCGNVTNQPCGGRLLNKQALLNHVSTAHHEIPDDRARYHHPCAPINSRSYPQKLFDRLTRKDNSTSN